MRSAPVILVKSVTRGRLGVALNLSRTFEGDRPGMGEGARERTYRVKS